MPETAKIILDLLTHWILLPANEAGTIILIC